MSHSFDEFSKSLAESVPRRESLRRFGWLVAGTILGPWGSDGAFAAVSDPCKKFCTRGTTKQRNACLTACRACLRSSGRVCGSAYGVVCCPSGSTCCGKYCADLANDFWNCGRCGTECREPGANEVGVCAGGRCRYACVPGAVRCGGKCKFLDSDPDNCGSCGKTCGGTKPYCRNGACASCPGGLTACGGNCVDTLTDPRNCGACGNVCGGATPYCHGGTCGNCPPGTTLCSGVCVNIYADTMNCGGCGIQCASFQTCTGGICEYPY